MTTLDWVLDGVIGLTVLVTALLAVGLRDRFSAVAAFILFGLTVAAAYARLAAPDLALAEAAIGSAVTGALLIGAVQVSGRHRDLQTSKTPRTSQGQPVARVGTGRPRSVVRAAVLGLGGAGVAAALLLAVARLLAAPPSPGLGEPVAADVPNSGAEHPVTSVLLAFRAYDTLLEVVVVLLAAVVALSLLPVPPTSVSPRPPAAAEALGFLVRLLVPVGVVAAGWLLLIGAYRPGGAFVGGAVLAGLLMAVLLSGRATPLQRVLPVGLALTSGAFLLVGAAGLLLRGSLLDYGRFDTAAVLALETTLALSVGVSLAALYLARRPLRLAR